jgi:hypothetical protein
MPHSPVKVGAERFVQTSPAGFADCFQLLKCPITRTQMLEFPHEHLKFTNMTK